MTGKSHLIFAAVTGGIIAFAFHETSLCNYGITISASLLGGLLPDIDNPRSTIGQVTKPISYLANKAVGHRTFFHSPLFLGILYLLLWQFCPLPQRYLTFLLRGLMGGLIGHLFLDMMTTRGIPLLYPFSRNCFSIIHGKSGGKSENVKLVFAIFLVCGGYWALYLR